MCQLTLALQLLVVSLVAVELLHYSVEALVVVSTTPSVTSGISSFCHNRAACHNRGRNIKASPMRLWAHRHQEVIIRDWQPSGEEPQIIYDFLLQREKQQQQQQKLTTTTINYDPEGSLELDVLNPSVLQESYSKSDGGCFCVATTMDDDIDKNDGENNNIIFGTLGMIVGTQVTYQSSGSSFSKKEITAAIRRVCASWPAYDDDDDDDDGDATNNQNLSKMSTTTILEKLIRYGEQRAIEAGATDLIGLAYPDDDDDEFLDEKSRKIISKPTKSIFESLGYRESEQQLPGVSTIQYEKKLSEKQILPPDGSEIVAREMTENIKNATTTITANREGIFISLATIIASFTLGVLVFNLYNNVFGIEQLWGSNDNGGIGTSLTTENLQELIRNEELGRYSIDEADNIATTAAKNIGVGGDIISKGGEDMVRKWEDLSPEELREEQALMKIIQGQTIRLK